MMRIEGKISIVVPVYNMEKYLRRCIHSILRQTHNNYEIILVNDGSLDRSREICDELKLTDSRILVIHQRNKGVSAARNAGIDAAHGEYITFVDPDDYLSPDMLETLYSVCKEHKVHLCQCMHLKTERDSEETPVYNLAKAVKIYRGAEPHYYLAGLNTGYVRCMVWATLYHYSLFDDLRFPDGQCHEDEAIMHHVLYKAGLMASVEAKLYFYYLNSNGFMKRKYNKARLDILNVLYERVMFYRKLGWTELEFVSFLRYQTMILDCYNKVKNNMENTEMILGDLQKRYASGLKQLHSYSFPDENMIRQLESWLQNPEEAPENIWRYAFEWVSAHPEIQS